MGSFGHSRLHELGNTTDRILHRSLFPLLIVH
jgi:nucleotide-binding universal stress UspA family protein